MKTFVLSALIAIFASSAYAEATIIPIGEGAYCVIYAKVNYSCTHSADKTKATCKGDIAAGKDAGVFVLTANTYPSKTKPPFRSGRTDLVECNAGTTVEWRGCWIKGENGPDGTSVRYSAKCGLCEKDGTNCRTFEGTLSITGITHGVKKASAQ
jgi:hypothetical protein